MFNMPSIVFYTKHPCLFFLFLSHNPQKPFISRCGSVLTGAFYIIYTYKGLGLYIFFTTFLVSRVFPLTYHQGLHWANITKSDYRNLHLYGFWGGIFRVCFSEANPKIVCLFTISSAIKHHTLLYLKIYPLPPLPPDDTMLEF